VDENRFEIDPDIAKASTLPGRFYTDPAVFERVKERVFAPSWQLVAHRDALAEPGDTLPVRLHEGLLDEPIVLTRDAQGTLRCLSNVCTHRGNLVVDEAGRRTSLACGYHGRRFDLDGRFRSMPGFEGAQGFPGPKDDLAQVPFGTWGRLLFASLAPARSSARPFDEWTADLRRRMGWLPIEEFRLEPSRSRDYEVKASWALYCDNYLEGFHIPWVHAALNAAIDFETYSTELFPCSSVQIALARHDQDAFDLPAGSPDQGRRIAGFYWFLFPNLMLNFYPWGLSVNVVRPLAIDRTRISFFAYVWKPEKLGRGAGADLDRVEREDEAVVEAVQRGVRSRLYDRGRYSPTREQGVHHFHRLLVDAVSVSA
jgi:choline monooxygenase